jgi:26S proteasome regulatory subunit N13
MALFGGTADERREPRSLVEFRAGKMSLSQGVATADKRKGLVYMKTSSDSLLHFCWKDRQTGEVVDDLIIFPGEAEFVTIPQCTTGRVFLLKFKDHSSRKFFYWMQEPSNSKDKELAKKVNELLTNPPEGGGGEGGLPDLPPGYMAIPSSQLQSMLSGGRVDQQQLMELLGGAAGGIPHALAGGGLGRAGGVTAERSGMPGALFYKSYFCEQMHAMPTLETSNHSYILLKLSYICCRASSQVSHTPTSSALPTATPRAPNRPTRSQQQQLDDLQSILSSLNVPGGTSAAESQQSSPGLNTSLFFLSPLSSCFLLSIPLLEFEGVIIIMIMIV